MPHRKRASKRKKRCGRCKCKRCRCRKPRRARRRRKRKCGRCKRARCVCRSRRRALRHKSGLKVSDLMGFGKGAYEMRMRVARELAAKSRSEQDALYNQRIAEAAAAALRKFPNDATKREKFERKAKRDAERKKKNALAFIKSRVRREGAKFGSTSPKEAALPEPTSWGKYALAAAGTAAALGGAYYMYKRSSAKKVGSLCKETTQDGEPTFNYRRKDGRWVCVSRDQLKAYQD